MENDFQTINKKSPKALIFIGIIVLLVGLIGFGYYHKNKPEVVFSTLVNKTSKSIKQSINVNQSKVDFDLSLNVDAGAEYKQITDLINNVLLKGSVNSDLKTNEVSANVKAEYKNKELINVDAYLDNKYMYVNLNDLFDKLISMKLDLEEENIKLNKDDVDTFVDEIINAFKAAIKEGKYSSSKVDLNGAKVTKNIFTIDSDNSEKVEKAFVEYLKNSDKFINAAVKVTGEKKEDILDLFKNAEYDKIEKAFNICVYTKGINNNIEKVAFEYDNSEIISITETSSKVYELKMNTGEENLTCIFKDLGNNKSTGTCNMEVEGIKVSYTINVSYKFNEKIEKPNTTNAISFEELTEEDTSKIMENLTKKDGVKDFMEVISSLMNTEQIEG